MKILKCIIFALTFAFWLPNANCQPPIASANFVKVEKEITTTPEFPGICNLEIGVVVTINEDFDEYLWYNPIGTSQTSRVPLRGKTVILKETGIWNIVCRYTVNGVECSETRTLFVADLNDPTQIQKYFESAGFYAVDISRNLPTGSPSGTQCMPENISFGSGNKDNLRPIIQGVFDNFKPLSSLGGGNIVLSENNCLCGEGIAKLEEQFNSGALSVWAHQFFGTADATTGKLFIKGRMPFDDALPIPIQKSHLASIHGNILSANGSTTEQGRVIFSNLFMPHPIGGYEPINNCNFSNQITNGSILLSPAAVPISLTSSFSDLRFGHNNDENGAFEGSLTYFSVSGIRYSGYINLEDNFAGYYNDTKGEVIEDFSLFSGNVACRGCQITLPTSCNGACNVNNINSEANYPTSNSGGIGFELADELYEVTFNDGNPYTIEELRTHIRAIADMCTRRCTDYVDYSDFFINWLYISQTEGTTYEATYKIAQIAQKVRLEIKGAHLMIFGSQITDVLAIVALPQLPKASSHIFKAVPIARQNVVIKKIIQLYQTVVSSFPALKYAEHFGILSYKELNVIFTYFKLAKSKLGIEVHHLIEKRFINVPGAKQWLGNKHEDWASIVLEKHNEHFDFSRLWREKISTKTNTVGTLGVNTTTAQLSHVKQAAREIYKDYPEILTHLGL